MGVALVVVAVAFAFMSGANDGATLVAMGTRTGAMSPLAALGVLAVAVAAVPAAIGLGVATTLAHGLVSFEENGGRLAFLAAAVAALVVVLVLSRRGLPTSLTLALSGGIVGAGLGAGLTVSWSTTAAVLAAGLLGPLLATAVGFLAAPAARAGVGRPAGSAGRARTLEGLGFAAQSFAYGANDAEKLVAFMAVATGASLDPVRAHLVSQLVVAGCFFCGTLFALPRVAARVTERMVRVRPEGALSAVVASSALVLAGSAVGMPLSSTQAATAGLVGSTARLTPYRVRLAEVYSIGLGWVLTLPIAGLLGVLLGLCTRGLR